MKRICLLLLCVALSAHAAKRYSAPELIELDKAGKPELKDAILSTFTTDKELKQGTAFVFHAGDFFFAIQADSEPKLVIDEGTPVAMKHLDGTMLWYAGVSGLKVSFDHMFHYVIDGKSFGGAYDLPALGPLSYLQPGVPSGTLTDPIERVSKVYPGMVSRYQVYVPAQYDAKVPAALMVFQDGSGYLNRNGIHPALNVIDNLIAMKKIPVMICVFVNPGDISKATDSPDYAFVLKYMKENGGTLASDSAAKNMTR